MTVAEDCPCGALRLMPPHTPETIDAPPWRAFIRCPDCDRFAVDYALSTASEEQIAAVAEFQWDYYIAGTSHKPPEDVEKAKNRLAEPWNASCVSILRDTVTPGAGVFDLGACAGAVLALGLPIGRYVGYEPNASYLDCARQIRAEFPVALHQRSTYDILRDRIEYERRARNVALCLMTLSHVPPDHCRRVIEMFARTFDEIVIQDYLGNDSDAENLVIMLRPKPHPAPNFPLFAHPYRKYLEAAGYRIIRTEPTRPLYQTFHW